MTFKELIIGVLCITLMGIGLGMIIQTVQPEPEQTAVEQISEPNIADVGAAPKFSATAIDGTAIDFPESYKGKLVMIDFWATWCGPCVAEIPNVRKAHQDHHANGFEVLGISLDEGSREKLVAFIKRNGMTWRHVHDGGGWDSPIAKLYGVSSIPHCLLVDGDTGEVVATGRNLHGPGLSGFIGKALAKKHWK